MRRKRNASPNSKNSRGNSDEQGFSKQLADDSAAPRAQRHAHPKLAHPASSAGKKQICGVAAGNHQHQAHCTKKKLEAAANIPHRAVDEVLDQCAPSSHSRVMQLIKLCHDGAHLCLRLRDGDPGLEAGDGKAA